MYNKGTSLSLNAVFKQTIGAELERRGFTKIKSRYPYYVRVVNGEILHIISFSEEKSIYKGKKSFRLYGGAGTIYRAGFEFSVRPEFSNTMIDMYNVYFRLVYGDDDFTYRNEELSLSFECSAEYEQMTNDMKQVFPVVENVLLYAFDKINDVDSCLKNHEYFNISMSIYEDDDFGAKWSGYPENEGLLYIKADKRQAITESHFRGIRYIENVIAAGKHPPIVSYEQFKQNIEDGYVRQLNAFDKIRNSKELYARALNELEQRAVNNKELLRLSTRLP